MSQSLQERYAPPPSGPQPPSVEAIQEARRQLTGRVRHTPTWEWQGLRIDDRKPAGATVHLKLELLQHAGSFKTRGVLLAMRQLDDAQRAAGVVAVSGGNHAMAVSWAARSAGVSAVVVMPQTANPARIAACRELGAEVVLVEHFGGACETAKAIEARDGRAYLPPFESEAMVLGAATLGMELLIQTGQLDALFVAIGGGGLAAGVAAAVKHFQPRCKVYGVEPEGADTMHRSFAAGEPQRIDAVRTVADSLGAPTALPHTYGLCRRLLDGLVRVDDDAICRSKWLLFADGKLAVEPGGAASLAGLLLMRSALAGPRRGVRVCGGNVDHRTFAQCLERGSLA
ncbi:MAG: threonine/serine dehydratase [Planctomycetota bacterium]